MEINNNPYGLFEIFRRDAREFLINKNKVTNLDLTTDEIIQLANKIEFQVVDNDYKWTSKTLHYLDDDTIFELRKLWDRTINP